MTNLTTLVYVLPNGHDFTVKVDVVGSEAAGLTVCVIIVLSRVNPLIELEYRSSL